MEEISSYFKFVSNERIDVLESGLIKFSPIGGFNDPFELEPVIQPLSRKFIEYWSNLTDLERAKVTMRDEDYIYSNERYGMLSLYIKKYKERIGKHGVLSLSTNNHVNSLIGVSVPEKLDPRRNILMWSHYANSHNGFVIEFSSGFIPKGNITKIEYSEKRDFLTFEDIDEGNFENVIFRKSIEWSYEQEYRCVLPINMAAKIIGDGKHYLFKFDKSKVRSITFGCKMCEEEKHKIIQYVKSCSDFGFVNFFHARLDDKSYVLDIYFDDGEWSNNPDSPYAMQMIPNQIKL